MPSINLEPVCGGVPEGQRALAGQLKAEEEDIGEEVAKAHRGVDQHGFYRRRTGRRTHYHRVLSGTASREDESMVGSLVTDNLNNTPSSVPWGLLSVFLRC